MGVNTSVAGSSGAMERSTETLTRWSKPADFGVPLNTRPWLSEMPDAVTPPVAVLVSLGGASTIRSVMPMYRPRCVESMMMRLSSLPTGSFASGLISQDA